MTLRNIVLGLVLGLGLVLLAPSSTGQAHHYRFMVANPRWNPGYLGGGPGTEPKLEGISRDWEIVGQSRLVCSDWGSYSSIPQGIRDAINAWEGVLTGIQLNQGCGSGRSAVWFLRRNVQGAWPCGDGWACTVRLFDPEIDPHRQAYYVGSTEIWIDDNFSYTTAGYQYVASHELGHVFGLDEGYIEPGYGCNSALTTVMDMGVRNGNQITGACPGDPTLPNATDKADTILLHTLNPMTQRTSSVPSPGVMLATFWEPSWADTGYWFYAYRWTGSTWVYTSQNWLHKDYVGWASHYVTTAYIKGSQPAGTYRLCGWSWNALLGQAYRGCFPSQYIP